MLRPEGFIVNAISPSVIPKPCKSGYPSPHEREPFADPPYCLHVAVGQSMKADELICSARTAEEIQAMWDRLKSLDPKATKPLSEAIERCGRCESDIGCAWIFRPRGFGKGRRAVGE